MSLLPEVLGVIERFLLRRKANRGRREVEHRVAVESVLAAVIATERYVFDRSRGRESSGSLESNLAKLWSKAALDVRKVDRRLSRIALLTSLAWANPRLLEDPKYRDVRSQLGLIRQQCEWLLDHWD